MVELEKEEEALVQSYLQIGTGSSAGWAIGFVVGVLIALAGVVMAVAVRSAAVDTIALLVLILGLVAMSRALEWRRRRILAAVLRKYNEAFSGPDTSVAEEDA